MKSFRVKFIGGLLLLAILILTCGLYGVYKFAKLVAGIYPMFMNMQYPMMVLCQAMVLGLIIALVFGPTSMDTRPVHACGTNFSSLVRHG